MSISAVSLNCRVLGFAFFCLPISARGDQLDQYVEAEMQQMHLPGLALAVVRRGEIVTTRAFGLADLKARTPVTPETVFEIGSVTKQFTAAAIMLLVEEKKIRLDDSISKYLPATPKAWDAITIRHLLTHSSGIANYLDVSDFPDIHKAGTSHDGITDLFFRRLRLEFPPGQTWSYSNSGYLLLGNIIEKVSGESYWDFLAERVFKPLEMNATRNSDPGAKIPRRASGYEWRHGRFEDRPPLAENAYAAGSIVSTLGDLAKWDAALYGGKLLSKSSFQTMWTANKTAASTTAPFNYGFGWFVDRYHGRRVVYHSGGTPGFSSIIHRFLDDGVTVIAFTNHADRVIDHLAIDIAGMYAPELVRPKDGVDADPETSQRLRKSLLSLFAGNPDMSCFTSAMQIFLGTATGKTVWPWLAADGELKTFTFSESEDAGDERILRYRAVLGEVTRWFSFTLTADGKIAQINWW